MSTETDIVDPPMDLYVMPEVRALTDVICDSIHREVCEPYATTGDGHAVGGAHQACETNFRHGAVAWLLMGMPMQRNLKPTMVTVECLSRVILDTAQCDLDPGHDGPHRFGEHITWADADELPTGTR